MMPGGISAARGLPASRTSARRNSTATPVLRSMAAALRMRREATFEPTVPRPSRPTPSAVGRGDTPLFSWTMTLLLREREVEGLLEMPAIVDAVEAATRDLGAGTAQNQPRRRVFAPGGLLNVMHASHPAAGLMGLKSYSVAAGRARFLVA